MSIADTHKKTGAILEAQGRLAGLRNKLEELRRTKKVSAKLFLEINDNKRGSSIEWLTLEEVDNILFSRMINAEGELAKLQSEYKS